MGHMLLPFNHSLALERFLWKFHKSFWKFSKAT